MDSLIDKDFQKIDLDFLNKCFDQLTLEYEQNHNFGNNGDCTEECLCCQNKSQIFDFTSNIVVTESDFKTNIKLENEENTESSEKLSETRSPNNVKVNSYFVKEEEIDDEDDSESSTEYSSDDENYTSLLERGGGKEKKKRLHRKKRYEPRVRYSPSDFNRSTLCHLSSGSFIENNSSSFHNQINLPSTSLYTIIAPNNSFNSTNTRLDFPLANKDSLYIPNISSPDSQDFSYVSSPDSGCFLNVSSPESGCDTSQSSVHSPSPPIVESTPSLVCYDHNEKQKINEIYNSILEYVESYQQNPNSLDPSCNGIEKVVDRGFESYECTSLISDCSYVNPANFQVLNTDEDSLLSELINPVLSHLEVNKCEVETSGFGLKILESAANQNPVLSSTSSKIDESCKRKLSYNVKDIARKALRNSEVFYDEKYRKEEGGMLRKIKSQMKRNEEVKIIDLDKREKYRNLQQTNLHSAVIESNVEKVYCIIEALKRYHLDLFNINDQDKDKKTALDYAIEQKNKLLIAYLEENTAVTAVKC